MAFNDFSMVLTVVVFCKFFSVLQYNMAAFVSVLINLIKLSYFKYYKNTTGTNEHCL